MIIKKKLKLKKMKKKNLGTDVFKTCFFLCGFWCSRILRLKSAF